MADETILQLDHEFGESAKLGSDVIENIENGGIDENGEKVEPLLPLPLKYKYLATLQAIEETINEPDLNGTVTLGKNTASARIDFSKWFKNLNKYTEKEAIELENKLALLINSKIQPCIKKVLIGDGLDPSKYYRSDMFFESQRQGHILIVYWRKIENDDTIRE